jgi:NMD protein affecting ribosome stability and mRNA decay
MAGFPFPCLECGRPTENTDRYVVCDACLLTIERELEAGRDRILRANGRPDPRCDALSQEEIDARVRRLLDDW